MPRRPPTIPPHAPGPVVSPAVGPDADLARRAWLQRSAASALSAATLGTGLWPLHPARAAPGGLPSNVGHGDSSPQWEQLRERLFGHQRLHVGSPGLVQLSVPLRAAYGASVPVKISSHLPQTPERHVRRLTLLVDKNPSPVAAVLTLTPELGQADFETRLRVDEYSHIRVVSELSDGSLHLDSRYVKVSGGCSAPPNRDAPQLIGRTSFRLPAGLHADGPTPAEVTVLHPNDTGFELNQVTLMFIPPHFVRSLRVSRGEALLFDADLDFSISENPTWRFHFLHRPGERLGAEVLDTREQHFSARFDPATGQAS
ncbi:sulfur-oxidizing protein SoxY [Sphaerotilus hippei]|uniref:Sulfur-oxidizing protein SoxY n=1 Tax=Sphaerotilus hippei TaxID=744406 RepID=A0A318H7J1_9BURK|nr:sulfur-oxidizing protein SoxY [Sphaerotilus hippei]